MSRLIRSAVLILLFFASLPSFAEIVRIVVDDTIQPISAE